MLLRAGSAGGIRLMRRRLEPAGAGVLGAAADPAATTLQLGPNHWAGKLPSAADLAFPGDIGGAMSAFGKRLASVEGEMPPVKRHRHRGMARIPPACGVELSGIAAAGWLVERPGASPAALGSRPRRRSAACAWFGGCGLTAGELPRRPSRSEQPRINQ